MSTQNCDEVWKVTDETTLHKEEIDVTYCRIKKLFFTITQNNLWTIGL